MKRKIRKRLWLGFDRALARNLLRQLTILGVVLLFALGLSYFFLTASNADWEQFCEDNDLNKWLLPLYLLIDSNALNNLYLGGHVHGWMLFASSITFIFGAFIFNGVIIGIITNSIEWRVKNHQEGHIHYLNSGHYIIMGYDDMVPSIITHIFKQDKESYILILTSAEVISIREKLQKSFSQKQMERIILNYGHRVSIDVYKDICLEAAEQVYVVGNHTKSAHDAINIECVDSICLYLNNPHIKQRPNRITCMFKDLDTYAAFKTSNIFKDVNKLGIEFIPYNFHTGWAKQVFVKNCYKDYNINEGNYKYPPVYGKGITSNGSEYVHLVFVCTTNFAVAFAMEAANVLHFPNAQNVKTLITFIDRNADKEKDEFITRNRHFFEIQKYAYYDLSDEQEEKKQQQGIRTEHLTFTGEEANFLDIEFEFIKGNIFSKKVQDKIAEWSKEHNEKQYLSIFLAMADQRQNFVLGMNMPDSVYDNAVPIFIRQDRSDNFVINLRETDKKDKANKLKYSIVNKEGKLEEKKRDARYANIYPFGMNETAYCEDNHSLKRAKLINYLYETANFNTYKFPSLLALDIMSPEQIWNDADMFWRNSKLTVALKWSNLYSAYSIRTKLAILRAMRGLEIDDTSHDYQPLSDYEAEQLAIVEHNRWNVEKLLMGYRKARKEEDKYEHNEFASELANNKKLFIHHDIRPYDKLGSIKELDKEFSRYIPWIMRMTEEE